MDEQIEFLRTLIAELREQRDDWRELALERGSEVERLKARNLWLSNHLTTAQKVIGESV